MRFPFQIILEKKNYYAIFTIFYQKNCVWYLLIAKIYLFIYKLLLLIFE